MKLNQPKQGKDSRGYWRVSYYAAGKRKYVYFGKGPSGRELAQIFLAEKTTEIYREERGLVKEIDLTDFLSEYLQYAKTNKARRSVVRDITVLKKIYPYLKGNKLNDITPQMIERYKTDRKMQVKPSTINRDLNTLKAAFNKAMQWGYLKENPLRSVKKFKEHQLPPRFFTHEEIKAFLKHLKDPDAKAAVLILLFTGMRRDELTHLEHSDIDLKNSRLFIRPKDDWHPKDYEFRTIPLGTQIKEILFSRSGTGPVFCRQKVSQRLSRIFKKALKNANIKGACLHTLRHTYASHLVMAGVDLATVQKLLGHADIKTTMKYAHLAPGHLQNAAQTLDKTFKQFSISSGIELGEIINLSA